MSTPNSVQACIELLESEARALATQAGERRDLAEQLRRIWDLPSIATPAPAPAAAARKSGAAPKPAVTPAKPAAAVGRPSHAIEAFQQHIRTELTSGPKRSLTMKPKGLHKREWPIWAKALRQMLSAGEVTVSGNRTGATYALVAKKASGPAAAAKPAPTSTREWPTGPIYRIVRQALEASTTTGPLNRRELLEAARRHDPSWEFTHIDNAVKALLSVGLIAMTASGTGDRFSLAGRG